MTFASKAELSARVLGSDRIRSGRANCSVKTTTFSIPLFDGISDAWIEFESRLRVRGGFNAINPLACTANPAACAAVRKALEKDPTLSFVNGRFVFAHSLAPPLPPPLPSPPPLFNVFNIPPPPPFPPTPSPPPPWYSHAETCMPVVTAAESDVLVPDSQMERAVCVYIRSVQDERVRAEKCFATLAPSPPPPPPTSNSRLAAINSKLLARRVRQGGNSDAEAALIKESMEEYNREAELKQARQIEYLKQLSTDNLQLRDVLGPVIDKVEGRRLWQRVTAHASHSFDDNILADTAFGNAPLVGVTIAECQALCDAIEGTKNGTCVAIAFARMNAAPTDLSVRQCYLLRGIGGCTPGSFAGAIFSRRDTSSCDAPTDADKPLCVQLANQRSDLRVLTFDESVAVCKHGKGRAEVAYPRTMLEAFSYLGYARERGVHSFWSDKPAEGGLMPWSGLDGQQLNVTAGDRRCVLVSTVSTDIHGPMFAELRPCGSRSADGVVCESASAAPPPPPGAGDYPPPPPPPPPIAVAASLQWYSRTVVRPMTEAICLAGLTDDDIYKLCIQFANQLSKATKVGVVSSFTPMCQDTCWHSCNGKSAQDRDGYNDCRGAECADSHCGEFLLNECPVETHAQIQRMIDTACSLGSPSPPPAPSPTPRPPPPPHAPPPLAGAHGDLRLKAAELPTSASCQPVSYAACLAASQEVGAHLGLSTNIEINLAPCEAKSLGSCFVGCSLGASSGAPALYTYLTDEQLAQFGAYNSIRCEAAQHEYCLCATELSPPPPPPERLDETTMQYSPAAVAGDYTSGSSAFYRLVATDVAMPESFRQETINYQCLGADTGAGHCARHCSEKLADDLVAFSVTGHVAPPPPPSTPSPRPPPSAPPSPLPPWNSQFNGATDSCARAGIYMGTQCRDGGRGSVFPSWCPYGSQVRAHPLLG